ncbi:MAG TPA: hypothetical protein VG917_00685 [Patescibacteria group bacterium]|nr:hypothetical protein [Patescibacteria group bacterium]
MKDITPAQKKVRGVLVALVVQYILGMTISHFGIPPEEETATHQAPYFAKLAFAAHGVVGLVLVVLSVVVLIVSLKEKNIFIKRVGIAAFLCVVIAFIAGIATISLKDSAAETASFIMGIAFLIALISYGKLFYLLKK